MVSKQPATTTQISKVELPAWVDKASQENYEFAKQVADKPYVEYGGQDIADKSPLLQQAMGILSSGQMNNQTGFNQASDLFTKAAGGSAYTGQSADLFSKMAQPNANMSAASALYNKAGQGINGLNRDDYMNPFTSSVIDTSVQTARDELNKSLMGNADRAIAAKAFGGNRAAVVDANSISQSNKDIASLVAQLNSANFNQATSAMQGDIGAMQNSASGLAGLGGQELGALGNAASGLGGLGAKETSDWLSAATGLSSNQTASNRDTLQQVSGLLTAGGLDQNYQQSILDAQRARWDAAQNEDLNDVNLKLAALGMSPYGQTQTTKTTQQDGSSGTDFAQLGLGLFSLLFSLSDERLKKNKEKVGTKIVRGKKVPIYEYNYIGQPKGSSKIKGPMAQDVEKVLPNSVVDVNGIKMVDKRVLGALSK